MTKLAILALLETLLIGLAVVFFNVFFAALGIPLGLLLLFLLTLGVKCVSR